MESWWSDQVAAPKLDTEIAEKLAQGIEAETGGRSVSELAKERDTLLVDLIAGVRQARQRLAEAP